MIGYHAREGAEQRILVYERLHYGSLDRLLYGRTDGPPIDWSVRVKVALCAAQGLTFLHEEGPFQVFTTCISMLYLRLFEFEMYYNSTSRESLELSLIHI